MIEEPPPSAYVVIREPRDVLAESVMSQLDQKDILMLNAVGAQICWCVEYSRVTKDRWDEDEVKPARC